MKPSVEYVTNQLHCGINIGDVVEVIRIAEDHEGGWGYCWVQDMDKCVGHVYKIENINSEYGFLLKGTRGMDGSGDYWFPYSVLKVTKPHNEKGNKPRRMLRVGKQKLKRREKKKTEWQQFFNENGDNILLAENLDISINKLFEMFSARLKDE